MAQGSLRSAAHVLTWPGFRELSGSRSPSPARLRDAPVGAWMHSVPAQRDLLLVSALSGALSCSLPTAQPWPPQSHRPPGCWQCPPHWSRDTNSGRKTELIRQLASSVPILLSSLVSRCPNPHAPYILSSFLGLFGKNKRASTVSIPSSPPWLAAEILAMVSGVF